MKQSDFIKIVRQVRNKPPSETFKALGGKKKVKRQKKGGPTLPEDYGGMTGDTNIPADIMLNKGKTEPFALEKWQVEQRQKEVMDIRSELEDNQMYSIIDPETGNIRNLYGYQISKQYLDPMTQNLSDMETSYVMAQTRFKNLPSYWKSRKTDEGYEYYIDTKLKQSYDEKIFQNQPLPVQAFRKGTEYFWTGAGLVWKGLEFAFNPYSHLKEGSLEKFQSGKISAGEFKKINLDYSLGDMWGKEFKKSSKWEQGLFDYGQAKDWKGATLHLATSPTALSVYTYGAFSVGSAAVSKYVAPKLIPKIKSYTGFSKDWLGKNIYSKIPQTVKDFPTKFSDIKLAKEMWKGYKGFGEPTYISSSQRSWVDFLGKQPFGKKEISYYTSPYSALETKMYAPIYGTASKYTAWQETQALRDLNRMRLDVIKYAKEHPQPLHIETATTIFTDAPGGKIIMEQWTKDKLVYSTATIKPGPLTKIEGKTSWKLNPTDVFFQDTKKFVQYTQSEHLGEVGEFSKMFTKGYSYPMKEIQHPLYGYHKKLIGTGTYAPAYDPMKTMGVSLYKTQYAGEKVIVGGFFKDLEHNITTGSSHGTWVSKDKWGTYTDFFKITTHPDSKYKNLYKPGVGDLGFNVDDVIQKVTDQLYLPGGIGVSATRTKSMMDMIRVFPKMTYKSNVMDDFVEQSSSQWMGVAPSIFTKTTPKIFMKASLFSGSINLSKFNIKSLLANEMKQEPLQIQMVMPKMTQANLLGSKSISILAGKQLTSGTLTINPFSTVPVTKPIPSFPQTIGGGGSSSKIKTRDYDYTIQPPPPPVPILFPKLGLDGYGGRGWNDSIWDEKYRFRKAQVYNPLKSMFSKPKKKKIAKTNTKKKKISLWR